MESVRYLPSQEAIQQLAGYVSGLKDTTYRKKRSVVGQVRVGENTVVSMFVPDSYLPTMVGCVYFNVGDVMAKACFPNSRPGELQASDLTEKLRQAEMAGLEAEFIFGGRGNTMSGKEQIPYVLSLRGHLFVKGPGKKPLLPVNLALLQLNLTDNPALWNHLLVQRAYQG